MALSRIPKPRTPRVGRPDGKFTQHRRFDALRDALERSPAGLPIADLAAMLHVSTRAIRRYLAEIHVGNAGIELESIETTPGGPHLWRIKPSERGRAVTLRRAQGYAILAARPVFDAIKGSALFDEVDLAMAQIEQLTHRPGRVATKGEIAGDVQLGGRFVYAPLPWRSYAARGEEVDAVFLATAELRPLRIRVRAKSRSDAPERIEFHPYAMVLHRGVVLALGKNVTRDRLEVMPLDRVSDARPSDTERFELPANFMVTDWLHGEQGVAPPARSRALVEFDSRIADEIRARRLHPAQKMATSADGRVRISIPLADRPALRTLIMGFGDAARVIEPLDLAREIADELGRAAKRYH